MSRAQHGSLNVLALLSLVAASACGLENSLVGGRCADGFDQVGTTCVTPGATPGVIIITPSDPPDGSTDDSSTADGQIVVDGGTPDRRDLIVVVTDPLRDAGPPPLLCVDSFVPCRGACIAVDDDGANCGACGKVCPSNICVAGECQGATPGNVVLIGHDFTDARLGTAQAKVLVNALSIPTTDPIRVLSYEIGAPPEGVAQVKAIAAGGVHGRTVQFTRGDASALGSNTLSQAYDVVLLHGATSGDPAALGSGWSASLQRFASKGGVVVALDNASSPMPAVLTSAGLLTVADHTKLPDNTHLIVTAAGDVVGAQVLSPYATSGAAVSFQGIAPGTTDLTWVVRHDYASGAGDPVVVHRVVR